MTTAVTAAAAPARAYEVVAVEQLIDDVWGERPPPSAAHSLEAYISRLRTLFAPHEPSLERRGRGYRLEPADALLDLLGFEEHALSRRDFWVGLGRAAAFSQALEPIGTAADCTAVMRA